MPSPFPDMDPYLEDPSIWPDLHSTMISYIREALQPQVRPKYVARIGERVEVADFGTKYVPDVILVEPPVGAPFLPETAGALASAFCANRKTFSVPRSIWWRSTC